MNKFNKTSVFPILEQYYTKFPFIFIIYSNEKSLGVWRENLSLKRNKKELQNQKMPLPSTLLKILLILIDFGRQVVN